MLAAGRGSIVNIGSLASMTALGRGHIAYSMAMGAVAQMTRELSTEWSGRGVRVNAIKESNEPLRKVHNPSHPSADAEGYVTQSNVNPVEEMVNMISASRSYQNNVEVMNTAKTLLLKTLQMGQ
ncbi:MAG TPA: flagellar basal body rod protein FlgC [Rhodoferax sp.]|nr:flagellar basal body rod protein FlgC [Rhodoferax sp.]